MTSYRDFELLVSRIEGALSPVGAVIRSPDHILDRFTNESREVDVSIRHRVGSVELLVTVECRDRSRMADVTWIEQLATKQAHIGAAHTIAVSSKGFSAPAISAAKQHGISTRVIGELSDQDILEWIDQVEVEEVDTALQLGELHLVFEGDHADASMVPDGEREWLHRGFDAMIFIDTATGLRLSLVDLIKRANNPKKSPTLGSNILSVTLAPTASIIYSADPLAVLARDVPSDGSMVKRMYWIEVTERELSMETESGVLNLTRVGFEITMSSSRRRKPASRIVSYSDDANRIVDVAEHYVGRFVIIQYRPTAKGPSQ